MRNSAPLALASSVVATNLDRRVSSTVRAGNPALARPHADNEHTQTLP